MAQTKKVCLVILDGWGHGRKDHSNAIFTAHTPFTDELYSKYPHAELRTDGENVGLPDGQMGNSEVGHMNLGAGRIVYQDLVKINVAVRNGSFFKEQVLLDAFAEAKRRGCAVHLTGLISNGGVHAHLDHLKALCDLAVQLEVPHVFIHGFTDGRDTDPKSGVDFISELENHIAGTSIKLATVIGRYYAMDRDKRWERIKLAYELLVHGKGEFVSSGLEALQLSYANDITDEFLLPCTLNRDPMALVKADDVVICFNFRTDRCREITQALSQRAFPEFAMSPLSLYYVTMTNYDESFKNVKVVYDKDNLSSTLGEILASNGKTQLRIAETEKYPHVTFFFSGGREAEFTGEWRVMLQSPKVATYDLQPTMSAAEITEAACNEMIDRKPDFICLNYANADMVGHTGVYDAIVRAVETVDSCLKQLVENGLRQGYSFVILADHGNADFAVNDDGTPNTAHTKNPVPVWILDAEVKQIHDGVLADIAPTILKLMHLEQPAIMNRLPLF